MFSLRAFITKLEEGSGEGGMALTLNSKSNGGNWKRNKTEEGKERMKEEERERKKERRGRIEGKRKRGGGEGERGGEQKANNHQGNVGCS